MTSAEVYGRWTISDPVPLTCRGEPADEAPAIPDETLAQRLAHVRLNLSVALKARAALQATRQSSADELAKIEKDIGMEADRLLLTRREALVEQVEETHARLLADIESLRAFCPDYASGGAVNIPRVPPSPRAVAALALLPRDELHTPVNILRGGQFNSAAHWVAARAALMRIPAKMTGCFAGT